MTYADILRPDENRRALLYDVMLVLFGSVLLAISAQPEILLPFSPVPITAQTLVVLLLGATLGSRRGAASVMVYLAQGAAGLPVFAGGAFGPYVFVGPTGGYLVGFVAAAFVVGLLAERGWDRHVGLTVAAMVIGNAVIYLFGAAWLGTLIGYENALAAGVVPFLIGDAIKIAIAAALLPAGWQLVGRDE